MHTCAGARMRPSTRLRPLREGKEGGREKERERKGNKERAGADVDNWLAMMTGEKTALITVGNCDHLGERRPTAARFFSESRLL